MRRTHILAACMLLTLAWPCTAATHGHVDTFPGTELADWAGGSGLSNPGTGGVGGANDGYLLVTNGVVSNFGTHSGSAFYQGNWTTAGITEVSFYLNDVNSDQAFSFHFMITDTLGTTWLYNTGFDPPNGSWQQYTVDLTNGANWTRTNGANSLAQTLQSVSRAHFRHDLPPYVSFPDPIAGDLGIDNIVLGPDCTPNGTPDPIHPDADGDGIIDGCDSCPNTIPGSPVDSSGCPPEIPGDFDRDGDVDSADLGHLQACDLGPNVPQDDAGCADAKLDADSDVDGDDLGLFQRCYSGTDVPGDPACAG